MLIDRLFDFYTILTLSTAGLVWLRLLSDWALDLEILIFCLAVCLIITGVITLLPILFSGLGTRDAVLIALFVPLGLSAEQAVTYSTLFFLTFYIGGGIIRAVAWQLKPLKA